MMDIDAMQAGPELDALVAREVMGWSATDIVDDNFGSGRRFVPPDGKGFTEIYRNASTSSSKPFVSIPQYSSEIEAAWEVVEKLMTRHTQDFHFGYRMCDGAEWRFGFMDKVHGYFGTASASAPTAPLAIARAALKAVRANNDAATVNRGG